MKKLFLTGAVILFAATMAGAAELRENDVAKEFSAEIIQPLPDQLRPSNPEYKNEPETDRQDHGDKWWQLEKA